MEKSESIKELATALNKVQSTLQAAKKESVNPYFKSKYADLLSVWNACRDDLTSNGLSVTQIADMDSEGRAVLETVLIHTSGEWIKGRLPLSTVKTDPQGQGSAITYARRYSLSAIIGLCTEEDDDAEAAMNRGKKEAKPTSSTKTSHQTKVTKTKVEPTPQKLGFIDGQWFRENLAEIQKHKGAAWSDEKLLNYLTKSYKVEGETKEEAVANLSQEAATHFVKKIEEALASIDTEFPELLGDT